MFQKTLEKTQGPQKQNPRTQDWIEKPKILGVNPRSGNAECGISGVLSILWTRRSQSYFLREQKRFI